MVISPEAVVAGMARVYLGRLPFRARESDIERFFQGYGRITDIAMKRGFAFIEFESKRDAEDAVDELNGRSILGDRVLVEIAKGRPHGSDVYRYRSRSRSRDRRRRSRSRSRSRDRSRRSSSRRRGRSRSRSRSASPKRSRGRRDSSRSSRSRSPVKKSRSRRSRSPKRDKRSRNSSPEKTSSRSPTPKKERSASRSASPEPKRAESPSERKSRSATPKDEKRDSSLSPSPKKARRTRSSSRESPDRSFSPRRDKSRSASPAGEKNGRSKSSDNGDRSRSRSRSRDRDRKDRQVIAVDLTAIDGKDESTITTTTPYADLYVAQFHFGQHHFAKSNAQGFIQLLQVASGFWSVSTAKLSVGQLSTFQFRLCLNMSKLLRLMEGDTHVVHEYDILSTSTEYTTILQQVTNLLLNILHE
ncbi:unnamed protein product [Cylicocyclus nassatus]|uniref:RRM domain-containing protein n=1 Tax=Cylicocyclus nassatus TaxID=53992 RepID=A0AA36MBG9_CYLNA|nr:unnamed protein product [Cylicocyclus nassatus]